MTAGRRSAPAAGTTEAQKTIDKTSTAMVMRFTAARQGYRHLPWAAATVGDQLERELEDDVTEFHVTTRGRVAPRSLTLADRVTPEDTITVSLEYAPGAAAIDAVALTAEDADAIFNAMSKAEHLEVASDTVASTVTAPAARTSVLEYALALARQGFYVFPARFKKTTDGWDKAPCIKGWQGLATRDEKTIEEWFHPTTGEFSSRAIGIYTGRFSDDPAMSLLVLDADDAPAVERLRELAKGSDGALPATRVHKTRRGFHLIYSITEPRSNYSPFKDGVFGETIAVDIRSTGGFIIAPGSRHPDGTMYSVAEDRAVVPAPHWLVDACHAPRQRQERTEGAGSVHPADLADVERAVTWLQHAPATPQGAGWHHASYAAACKVRDMGVFDPAECFQLMADHWYPRSPGYDEEELRKQVDCAYEYAENASPGNESVNALASAFSVLPTEVSNREGAQTSDAKPHPVFGNVLQLGALRSGFQCKPEPRKHLWGRYIFQGKTYMVAGFGGSSKTQFAIELAMHVVLGREYLGQPVASGAAIVVLGEEDEEEVSRRIGAIVYDMELDGNEIALLQRQLRVVPAAGKDIHLTVRGGTALVPTGAADALVKQCAQLDAPVRLIVLDHAMMIHGGDMSSNDEVTVTTTQMANIATRTGAAVAVVAHSPKASQGKDKLDQHDIMGAAAWGNNTRGTLLLRRMTEKEAPTYDIGPQMRSRYVSLQSAKNNYGPSGPICWLEQIDQPDFGTVTLRRADLVPKSGDKEDAEQRIIAVVRANPGRYSATELAKMGKDHLGVGDQKARPIIDAMLSDRRLKTRQQTREECDDYGGSRPKQAVVVLGNVPKPAPMPDSADKVFDEEPASA
jgi:hypothetical protein